MTRRARAGITQERPHRATFLEHVPGDSPLAMRPDAVGAEHDVPDDLPYGVDVADGVAVISIDGPLTHHDCWFWQSYDRIGELFSCAVSHPDVRAILLRIDSPGGEVSGLFDLVAAMRAQKAKAGKPVYAIANDGAYSAAYALSCVADEIYLTAAGGVGSVGVITVMYDRTAMTKAMGLNVQVITSGKQKGDGHPDKPLTDDVIARVQTRIDQLADLFAAVVSESRGLSPKKVLGLEAACLYGDDAVTARLADGVMSFDDALLAARGLTAPTSGAAGESAAPTPQGDTTMLLTLQKAVDSATKALAAAKTEDEKDRAEKALASAQAALEAAKADKSKADDDEAEDDSDDGDAEDEDADDDDSEDDADDDDAEDDSDDEGDDDDDKKDDDDEDSKAASKLLLEVTGAKSIAEARGVLAAMQQSHKRAAKLAKSVERLERDSKRNRVAKLVREGMTAGKITPAMKGWATELGMGNVKSLRAFLAAAAPVVATKKEGGHTADDKRLAGTNAYGLTEQELTIARKLQLDPAAVAKTKLKIANGELHVSVTPTVH